MTTVLTHLSGNFYICNQGKDEGSAGWNQDEHHFHQ